MDKRKQENIRVKRCIIDALFRLMQTKSLSDITITELVQGAGVARASFYRNYDSKEDVLVTLIRDVLELFRRDIKESPQGLYAYENIRLSFQYFYKYKSYLLDLYRAGFALVILDDLNHFHESVEGTMRFSSTERYVLYMYIGALFNTAMTWLLDENPAELEQIAEFFYRKVQRCLAPEEEAENGKTGGPVAGEE